MKHIKVRADIKKSAAGTKAHYDVWWAQVSDAKPQFVSVMNEHSAFFHASQDAHYMACFSYLAHLFDKRSDSSSLPTYLSLIRDQTEPSKFQEIEARNAALADRAKPLLTVRHKTVAHIDARLSEKDVFAPLNITWNEIRSIIHDVAAFVEQLTRVPEVAIEIPRDGLLRESTLKLLRAVK
jgi:hypothetical protein